MEPTFACAFTFLVFVSQARTLRPFVVNTTDYSLGCDDVVSSECLEAQYGDLS